MVWYESKTIWGLTIAALSQLTGFIITGDETTDIINALTDIGNAVGILFAVYGRVVARSPLRIA